MAKISINLQKGTVEKEQPQGELIVGIDLGTTNSLVAYVDVDGKPVVVRDADGKNALVPSVIWLNGEQTVIGDWQKIS